VDDVIREAVCSRFRSDGAPCNNTTGNADGWCRQPGCEGFLRRSASGAPESLGAPRGTRTHIANAASPRPDGVDFDQVDEVFVTRRAVESFLFHHGGDRGAAEIEILTMLEDFSLRGVARQSSGGFIALARDGFEIVLSPDRDTVTNYSTMHRERTWSQFKAGVRSRFGTVTRKGLPAPIESTPVSVDSPEQILDLLDIDGIHLSNSAFSRGAKMMEAALEADEVEVFIRQALQEDVAAEPIVECSETGAYVIRALTRTWIVRADLLMILGVRPV